MCTARKAHSPPYNKSLHSHLSPDPAHPHKLLPPCRRCVKCNYVGLYLSNNECLDCDSSGEGFCDVCSPDGRCARCATDELGGYGGLALVGGQCKRCGVLWW